MDKKGKKVRPSSSFAVDLFGPKDSSQSSTGYFGSMFGPSTTMVHGRDATRPDSQYPKRDTTADVYNKKKEKNYESERSVEPCYYNSSIYYGGQEVYTPTSQHVSPPPNNFKKDGENDDANESDSSGVSRGNWWKGSLYY